MGIAIKDAQLVEQVTGNEKIPVSDGSGQPRAVTTEQIKEYIGNGGDDNVQSDWNETDPTSDAFIKNKPTIPSEVTEQTVTDWGFTKNTGDYSKPSTGIPKSDLASDVQSSLGKADTALQEHQDISGLATKSELNNKQDTLVSGTNIKTINGKNILGEGNIVIEGGGSVDLSDYATKAELKGKVDKVDGKQLSTEDFTTLLKQKLEGLSNYDDTSIIQAVQSLQGQINTLVSDNASTAIESFNEIIAFLQGITDSEDLDSIIASIEQQIVVKQDKISDLDAIRSGASKGATALQSVPSNYVTTTMLNEAIEKAITNTLAEKV